MGAAGKSDAWIIALSPPGGMDAHRALRQEKLRTTNAPRLGPENMFTGVEKSIAILDWGRRAEGPPNCPARGKGKRPRFPAGSGEV